MTQDIHTHYSEMAPEELKAQTPPAEAETHTSQQAPASAAPGESRNFVWLAVVSIVLTVAAWIAGSFNGIAAMILCVAAIVAGAFSLKSRRHSVRNTAITSIIAAAVLLVVVAAFLMVIYIGLNKV